MKTRRYWQSYLFPDWRCRHNHRKRSTALRCLQFRRKWCNRPHEFDKDYVQFERVTR